MTKTTSLQITESENNKKVTYFLSEQTGYSIRVEKTKNDINGNPMYKAVFNNHDDMADKTNIHIHRRYLSKGYVTLQSFDISQTIIKIMNHIEKGVK